MRAILRTSEDQDQHGPVQSQAAQQRMPFRSIRYWAYYNLLTAYDVLQAGAWRLIAPTVDDAAFNANYKMVFVLGCGRSGTTILSHCLGQHHMIAELNEPAHLWVGTHASMDILSPFARLVRGRLRLDSLDVTERTKSRYRAMLDFQVRRGRPVICDKLPQNTFRVDFLNAVCPKAKFILIERSPRAVASSIEQCVARDGTWWGFNDYKWRSLVQYALTQPQLAELIPYAVDHYYRGLIEWRISRDLVNADLSQVEPERQMRVSYEDFCSRPEHVMRDLMTFCEVPHDPKALAFASSQVKPNPRREEGGRCSPFDQNVHERMLSGDPASGLSQQRDVA